MAPPTSRPGAPVAGALVAVLLVGLGCAAAPREPASARPEGDAGAAEVPAPTFESNPQLDVILTNARPILSVANPAGLVGPYTLTFELSTDPGFPPAATRTYPGIGQHDAHISEVQVRPEHALADGTYHWRVRTVLPGGRASAWVQTRFHVDVAGAQTFAGFRRAPVAAVRVSGGQDPKNLVDWNDQGQLTYWNSAPRGAAGTDPWVVLDLGRPTPVTRVWMLSTRRTTPAPGWLRHFLWQGSDDGERWTDIPGAEVRDNDTYRNIVDFAPVNARFYRLVIRAQNALQAQLHTIIPYVRGQPPVPTVPAGDYVLLVGNQLDGGTYTRLAEFVERAGLPTVTVPHHEISLAVLRGLAHPPLAIIFSGNNADWQYLPMFEYYGEFEIYRTVDDIPLLGICAGHEFFALAHGLSFARWMGWFDNTMFRLGAGESPAPVEILPAFAEHPLVRGVPNPFRTVEIHSWAISPLFLADPRYPEWEEMARTSYIQMLRSTRRPAFSAQFHPAVVNDHNQGGAVLINFLELARRLRQPPAAAP